MNKISTSLKGKAIASNTAKNAELNAREGGPSEAWIPALAWDKLASTKSCPIDFLLAYQLLESSPKNDISMEDIWLNVFELYRSLGSKKCRGVHSR